MWGPHMECRLPVCDFCSRDWTVRITWKIKWPVGMDFLRELKVEKGGRNFLNKREVVLETSGNPQGRI